MASRMIEPVRSVLVLTKHRFMGDTIVAIPLLRATRRAYPEARITLVTGAFAAEVLQNCPYVDRLIAHDPESAKRTAAGKTRLATALLREMLALHRIDRPDLCLIADRSFRTAIAALVAGGRCRAGFDTEGRGWLLTDPIPYDHDKPETECCLDILRAVRPELPNEPRYDPRPELWLTAEEKARGGEILRVQEIAPLQPLIGVQPGASHDYKQWRPERFAEVAQALAEESGATIVLVGYGPDELEAARRMREAMSSDVPVIDLTNKTKMRATMGVLSHLSLFLGNDTGVNHIAAALGVPTVALFGPTPAHKWGNSGPCNRVLAAPQEDMDGLSVAAVLEAARSLLGLPSPSLPPPIDSAGDGVAGLAVGAQR